jgi:hypothetical protein
MIRVKTFNGVTLQPSPGSTMEVERNSPFFSTGDEWAGERSTPINFPYSKSNAKELGYPYHFYTKRIKRIVDADLYDGTMYRQRGKLITENSTIDQNHIHRSDIRGYFVFALSNFYQIIKDKKLRSLSLGGKRSFNWTTSDPDDASGGFWQYIHSTWDGTKDFLVAPVRNEEYGDPLIIGIPGGGTLTLANDWMNRLGDDGKLHYEFNKALDSVCPQIKVKYLLEKIFTEHGYTITYDVGDTQWESLFLNSLIPFKWTDVEETDDWPYVEFNPKAVIDVYLNEHLPDRTLSDFLVQLGNRYGWRFLINDETKVCKIKSVRNILNGTRKDWTAYCSSVFESDFSSGTRIFSFKNDIDSGDNLPVRGEFEDKVRLADVFSFNDLPTATGTLFNNIAYSHIENTFWIVAQDEGAETYSWEIFADNIFDFEPDGETDNISTTMSTLPVARTEYLTILGVDKYGIFPVMKQKAKLDFGYRVLFYQGIVPDQLADGTFSTGEYPHLSSLWRVPGPADDKVWSNVFVHDYTGGIKRGIIEYWFKDWIAIISEGEDIKVTMNLPRLELMNFQWDDIILIKNIPYLVKGIIEPFPYKNKVEATLRRIG